MTASVWLSVTLTIWLLVTIIRQVFDLIGKLWIPIGFNLLQILCCITGLFGVCQGRVLLLVALSISCAISICQNALIALWYIGVFGDISRPVLSAGLPYSYSFFLRHTPSCGARYDLHSSKWVQAPCVVPYNQIEAGQALLHIILAGITLILSVAVVLQRRSEKDRQKLPLSQQYAQIKRNQLPSPLSISELRSGCVDSSSDDLMVAGATLPEQRAPPLSYERHNRSKRARIRPNSMPETQFDQYSCMTTSDRNDFVSKQRTRRFSSTTNGRFQKSCELPRLGDVRNSDEPNEQEFGKPPGALTSLISFDPKSGTLLRVREHRGSDEDEAEGYCRIEKEPADSGLYECIRAKTPRNRLIPSSTADQSLTKSRLGDHSHDSLPSVTAPVLNAENLKYGFERLDLCPPRSPYYPLPSSSSQADHQMISRFPRSVESPRGEPTRDEDSNLVGGSLGYKGNFRVEAKDNCTAIGHYHAINEFRLTNKSPQQTMPVITGAGLLV
ncbi:hypothetical protein GCK32_005378 [Trichostrongylus colubriformis]|uniref:Sodium/potassium-transporting ATPase subunit beta-1-interacting protein n=1 Tax=Trichostrongylus colubriformis TaxID=6319 RepID=A0AAN8F8M7_TRICO